MPITKCYQHMCDNCDKKEIFFFGDILPDEWVSMDSYEVRWAKSDNEHQTKKYDSRLFCSVDCMCEYILDINAVVKEEIRRIVDGE